MTATERLRELLDERGVEWGTNETIPGFTRWYVGKLKCSAAVANGTFLLNVANLTPEQAIAATLGNDGVERSKNGVAETCVPDDYTAKLMAEVERLQAENAKLRELCKLAFTCIVQGEDEYGTDWSCAGCELCDKCDGLIQARATAQELGVEVDA